MKKTLPVIIFLFSIQTFAQTYNFTFDNILRSYIVHLPSGYNSNTQYPLVINLHGYTSTAAQQQAYSQMDVVADTGKFIVVYPDGVNNGWNAGFGVNPTINDVGFLSAMIDTLKNKFSINSNKIFSCGLSNGGFMSFRLACELQDKIAAIAPVSGPMSDSTRLFCQNTCPVPLMYFHGTADGVVNYNGALGYVSVDSTISIWVGKDACPKTPVVTAIPDINIADGCTVTKYLYAPGQNSSEVIFFKITGGGHTWPGGIPVANLGNTNQDIKASGEIWNFFRRHSLLCGSNEVSESVLGNNPISVFPNPSDGKFSIQSSVFGIQNFILLNVLGETVCRSSGISSKENIFNVDISDFSNGIYIFKAETSKGVIFQKIVKQ